MFGQGQEKVTLKILMLYLNMKQTVRHNVKATVKK